MIPIKVLTTIGATERQRRMLLRLSALKASFEFSETEADSDFPVAGCCRAHLKALEETKPPFLVLEDDCVLRSDAFTILQAALADLVKYTEASKLSFVRLFLGALVTPDSILKPLTKSLFKGFNLLHAHAYVVSPEGHAVLRELYRQSLRLRPSHNDWWVARQLEKQGKGDLLLNPIVAVQEKGWSATDRASQNRTDEYFNPNAPSNWSREEFFRNVKEVA